MRIFKFSFLSLLMTFAFGRAVAGVENQTKTDPTSFIEFINSFETIEDQLQGSVVMGVLSSADKEEILEFLAEQKVAVRKPAPKIGWNQGQFMIGDKGWSYQEGQGYRTQSGRVVKIDLQKSPVENFKKMYLALMEKSQASMWSLWISSAYAQSKKKRYSAEKDLVNALGQAGARLAGTVIFHPSIILVDSIAGAIAEGILSVQKFFNVGKVECQMDQFVITKGYSRKYMTLIEDMGGPKKICQNLNREKEYFRAGASDTMCELSYQVEQYWSNAQQAEADRYYVNDKKLMSIFKKDKVPVCTEDRAEIVEKALKEEAKKVLRAQDGKKSSASKGPSSSMGAATR